MSRSFYVAKESPKKISTLNTKDGILKLSVPKKDKKAVGTEEIYIH